MWFQRSRKEWIRSGERNTKFYHAATTARKYRNKCETLKNEKGEWTTDHTSLEEMIHNYFQALFTSETPNNPNSNTPNGFPTIKDFTREEIKQPVFDMDPFKSPDNDEFHAGFYQKTWETVGHSVCDHVLQFLSTGILPEGTNETLLALIPKVPHPDSIS